VICVLFIHHFFLGTHSRTLAHNELSTIEDGAFEDVSLKSGILDLSFNKLTTIGQHLFTGLKVTVKGTSSGPIL
jgi:hypothetical protein